MALGLYHNGHTLHRGLTRGRLLATDKTQLASARCLANLQPHRTNGKTRPQSPRPLPQQQADRPAGADSAALLGCSRQYVVRNRPCQVQLGP